MTMRTLIGLSLAAGLAGCAATPPYSRPAVDTQPAWQGDGPWRPAQPADTQLRGNWWVAFNDAELNTLETAALINNQSLKAAFANLDASHALLDQARAGLFPQVNLSAQGNRVRTSANRPSASYSTSSTATVQNDFVVGAQVSYEADLFGRVRANLASARASDEAAIANFENVRLMLTATVASTYYSLRELDSELAVTRASLSLQDKAAKLIEARHDAGNASGLDVAQQETLLDSTRSQLELLVRQRVQLEHALATLCGTPATGFHIEPGVMGDTLPAIPMGVPADILERRPDIAAAERSVAVANAQIGVAQAAFFPSIMLNAGIGQESHLLSTLPNAPSYLWSLGSAAALTVFDAGRNRARADQAEAGYTAAVATYRQTVLTAFQEVEDNLSAIDILSRAATDAQTAVTHANQAYEIANTRYEGGVANVLDVITAEQALLANQRTLAQINGQRWQATVFLVKALGGGWQPKPAQASTPTASR